MACASDPFSLYTAARSPAKGVQSAMWYASRAPRWLLGRQPFLLDSSPTCTPGNRLSTEAGGILRITIPSLTLQLGGVQRGALEFSYHAIAKRCREGKTYRVFLDPSEREVAASGSDQAPNRPWNHHRTFILVSIAVAVAAGIAIPVIIHDVESPDRPGQTPPNKP